MCKATESSFCEGQFIFAFRQEMDTWYRTKFQDLSNTSTKHAQSVQNLREEIASYKKDVSVISGFVCGAIISK